MLFKHALEIEQVKALFSSLRFVLTATFMASLLIVWTLWDVFPATDILIWLALSIVILLGRGWSGRHYDPDKVDIDNARSWLNQFTFFTFLAGVNWGLMAIFFFSAEQPGYILFLTMIYAGLIAISLSTNGLYAPTFLSFSIPLTLLFLVQVFRQTDEVYTSIGIMMVFFFFIVLFFARNIRELFATSCRLNYEKNALLLEITAQKEVAEKAVDAKNQFLAAASHDLRQPLHALGLFVDALAPHISSADGKQIINKISQSKHAINGLLHGLLDISRLDAKVVENFPQHIALSSIIPTIEEYQANASAKNIKLVNQVNPDHFVYVDPVLIERVIRNLIDNAIKYTAEGSVQIKTIETPNHIEMRIEDTGMGIATDDQDTIFVEFKQLNNTERDRQKGLGLGLSIVKRLCDLMEISFELRSERGAGTQFFLYLPKGEVTKRESIANDKVISLQDLMVVVIDDEKDILAGMNIILGNLGCHVVLALTGDEALEKLHQIKRIPDLIIADLRLRENKTGIEVIERIREEYNADINAILITGDTAPDRLKLGHLADVSVMHKPVETADLTANIQRLITH